MIYFDNSATTKPPYPEALTTYTEVATGFGGEPF